ncbi:hypothetical protein PRIPAC_78381, partial [Pristionchus pacificus]|uniref:glucuronosyltransferase n=1 Tax=Pristionchus pacificus TaxID=54126 RepID=A0A2A6C2L7_PRIPA
MNILLIHLIIVRTPIHLRSYAVMLLLYVSWPIICEPLVSSLSAYEMVTIMACFTCFPRVISLGIDGILIAYYGPCSYLNLPNPFCFCVYSFLLNGFTYYNLLIDYYFDFVDKFDLEPLIERHHPNYDLSNTSYLGYNGSPCRYTQSSSFYHYIQNNTCDYHGTSLSLHQFLHGKNIMGHLPCTTHFPVSELECDEFHNKDSSYTSRFFACLHEIFFEGAVAQWLCARNAIRKVTSSTPPALRTTQTKGALHSNLFISQLFLVCVIFFILGQFKIVQHPILEYGVHFVRYDSETIVKTRCRSGKYASLSARSSLFTSLSRAKTSGIDPTLIYIISLFSLVFTSISSSISMGTFSLLILITTTLQLSLANDANLQTTHPLAVFVLMRSASIDLPLHEMSEQAERYFYRGRDQLAEENVRLSYRQGEEFRRRYVFSGMLDKRYLPISSALHFSSGLFGSKIDGTPIIPVVEYYQKDVFEKLLLDEKAAACDVFSPSLIKAAVVMSENPRAQLISSGVGVMNTTSSILSVSSFFAEISSSFRRCEGESKRCEPIRKFDSFITDGRPLLVLSHILSLQEVWNESPPPPCAAFIVEVMPTEPRFVVFFKRDIHSQFEELIKFTLTEWMNITSIHEDEIGSLLLESSSNITRLDDDLTVHEPFLHEDTLFIIQILSYFVVALVFTTFIRVETAKYTNTNSGGALERSVENEQLMHKILVYNVKFAHSHANYLGNVADILVDAGHHVISFIPEVVAKYSDGTKKSKIVRIPPIEEASEQILSINDGEVDLFSASAFNPIVTILMSRRFAHAFTLMCESTLDSGIVEKLRDEKFDVYFVEGMDICGLMLAHLIQSKSIIMASTTTMIHGEQHEDIGVPQILSCNPSPNVASHDIHSLWYSSDHPIVELDIVSNVTYAFTNSEPLIDFGIPTISRVVHVGRLGVKEPQPLDDHWSEVLSRRERAVLISFGSLAKSYLLRPEAKRAILKTVFRFPNVTTSDPTMTLGDASKLDNLVLAKWMPQNDLLAHQNMSLFITHGGMGSVQELTLRGVPAILVPIFADLSRNAERIEYNQLGKDKSDIANDEKLTDFIMELLENDQYRQNAKRTAEMLSSKPFSSKELLLKHVDFTARFGPSRALRPLSIDMAWIEYYNVDAIIVAIISAIIIILGNKHNQRKERDEYVIEEAQTFEIVELTCRGVKD